jgi:hypothetical protein
MTNFCCQNTTAKWGSKKKNRSITKIAKCMLKGGHLNDQFWAKASQRTVFLLNHNPKKTVHGRTPYEAWLGRKPEVTNFKVFGCLAYAHVPDTDRHKLEVKSVKFQTPPTFKSH